MITATSAAMAQDIALSRAGQPDTWVITGIKPNERLSLRILPGTMFDATGTVQLDERVHNSGCADVFGARWCKIEKLSGTKAAGFVRSKYLTDTPTAPPSDDSLTGGPDVWQVFGLKPNDRLNIRSTPSVQGRLLGTLRNGDTARNLGCQLVNGTRWCQIRTIGGARTTGYVSGRFLREAVATTPQPPPVEPPAREPDFWRVHGLSSGDRLNIRQAPSAQSPILATLSEGERVRNLGCEMAGKTRWCLIRSTVGADVTGYVNGRYLRESR